MGELGEKLIDYYFMELSSGNTSKMTDMFKDCYPNGPNAPVGFNVIPASSDPGDFMPLVLRSINMSALRSGSYFSKRSTDTAAPVFSTLGLDDY